MSETGVRMVEPGEPPSMEEIEYWIGKKAYGFWKRVANEIEQSYPDIFSPEWLFGGKKHGWYLRYKKSKSFCQMVPEKNRFMLLIVFGATEREKVETIRVELTARTQKAYDDATTYHDGKWLLLHVDDDETVADVKRLLAVKRKPKTPQ